MELFPAIDLKDGRCVRLAQGDFERSTIYESDPVKQARAFAEAGATWLHMVDLDGAKAGEMQQFDLIERIVKETSLKVQTGGGIRGERTVEKLLKIGVERVVIGSIAVKNRTSVRDWLGAFGPRHLTLAFDVRVTDGAPEVLTHGWQAGSRQLLWDILDGYEGSGLKNILCTDVARDGMLTGTNNGLYRLVMDHAPRLDLQASGGVSSLADLRDLARLGVAGVIVGKALYENKFTLSDALKEVRDAG